jgi:tetratricopeptide (TPR) repeat protein
MSEGSDPADAVALASALVSASRWDAALAIIGPALAADPENRVLLALLLRCLRALGRPTQAVDAAQRLLMAAPNDPYSFRLATLVLLDVGWVDEAIGLAARAVALDPNNSANHLALARAWAQSPRRGSVERALESAREAVLLAPNSPDAQVQIGAALAAQGDADAARLAYLEALRLAPGHPAALNNLAVLDLRSGNSTGAAKQLAAALAADPQDSAARRNLDAAAIRVLRRMMWWTLLAPIPALVAAAAGAPLLTVLLAGVVMVSPGVVGWRWWHALAPGQRSYLRSLPRRVRRRTLVWPILGAVLGGGALVASCLPFVPKESLLGGYVAAVVCLILIRTLFQLDRLGPQAFAADTRMRWQRLRHGRHRGVRPS